MEWLIVFCAISLGLAIYALLGVHKVFKLQQARIPDKLREPTKDLITIWKREIKNHEKSSVTYKTYKSRLEGCGHWHGD